MRFWFLLALTVFLRPLTAFEGAPIPIPELAKHADLIVRGKVAEKSIKRDPAGRIYTETKLNISEALKGDPKSAFLTIVSAGGTLGEQRDFSPDDVSYSINEEVIAFLVWNPPGHGVTLNGSQGKFQINKNQAASAAHKLPLADLKSLAASK
jgi:hypothetical protein